MVWSHLRSARLPPSLRSGGLLPGAPFPLGYMYVEDYQYRTCRLNIRSDLTVVGGCAKDLARDWYYCSFGIFSLFFCWVLSSHCSLPLAAVLCLSPYPLGRTFPRPRGLVQRFRESPHTCWLLTVSSLFGKLRVGQEWVTSQRRKDVHVDLGFWARFFASPEDSHRNAWFDSGTCV